MNSKRRIAFPHLLVLVGLLGLPLLAIHRHGVDLFRAGAFSLVTSALTYLVYSVDKRRARNQAWRIPEVYLHILELLGGWPGAWLAQRRLRHKCSKGSYQLVFWLIVFTHQFVAFDSLQDWRVIRGGAALLPPWRSASATGGRPIEFLSSSPWQNRDIAKAA